MKIEQFIDEFNKSQSKETFVRKHVVKEYLPYAQKISCCHKVAEQSTHKEVQGKNVFYVDSAARYMLFVFTIIENYTDIELGEQGKDKVNAFDLLEEYNVMFFLSAALGDEYKRLDTVLKMQVDDIYSNERDFASFLETKADALALVLERIGELYEQKNKQPDRAKNQGA